MSLISKTRRGFTIIELLVVIAIILVLAGILFPVFAKAKQSALRTAAMSQSKQLGTALTLYVDQSDGKYLPSTNYGLPDKSPQKMWQTGLVGIAKDQKIFVAPGSEGKFAENWADRGEMSIGYNSATAVDKQQGCSTIKKTPITVLHSRRQQNSRRMKILRRSACSRSLLTVQPPTTIGDTNSVHTTGHPTQIIQSLVPLW